MTFRLVETRTGQRGLQGTYLVDRDTCGGAFQHLGDEGQVLKGGVVVIEVQEVHKHSGTAGGLQRRPATWENGEERVAERKERGV